MSKIIKIEQECKEKILAGVEKLEKTVCSTLGPSGKNVAISEFGMVKSTKDGITVAKSIELADPFENIGSSLLREASNKTNMIGDGTTTTIAIGASIFRNGLKYTTLGSNVTHITNGIKKAAKFVVDYIKENTIPIFSKEDVKKVALISANGNEEIAETIADIVIKLGTDAAIKIENGQTSEIYSKVVEGMTFDSGLISPYMVTNEEKMVAELDEPFILISNKKASNPQELLECLQSVARTGKPLVIIAEDFTDEVTSMLVINKMRGFNIVAVKSPSYGDNRKAILQDIAIATGGAVVSEETGIKFEHATIDNNVLGLAKQVVISKDNTVIIGGMGNPDIISERVNAIKSQIENSTETYEVEKLKERLSKLTSGIGIISVGGLTEAEQKFNRDVVDDAFAAAKSALKSGIVAGGGSILISAKKELEKYIETLSKLNNTDESNGYRILSKSLETPLSSIIKNAGLDQLIVSNIMANTEMPNYGYDIITKKYGDMIELGVIDPSEVVQAEILNGSAAACMLLTTDAIIVDKPENKENSSCSCNSHM